MTLAAILLATLLAGIGSVWLAALLGFGLLSRYTQHMLSLAAGALLATSFTLLLPEAFESGAAPTHLLATVLACLVFFFLLDKAELWHHGHEHHHGPEEARSEGDRPGQAHAHGHHHPGVHVHSGGWTVLMGDSLHCFSDGVLIASAFIADPGLGWLAALAVLMHEVPHHMGDLAVVRETSASRRMAVIKVSLAGALTMLGGAAGFYLVDQLRGYLPYFLVVAASSFMYVALADLMPQLQKKLSTRETLAQLFWLATGLLLVLGAASLAHGGHGH